jgi:hypothetical protein
VTPASASWLALLALATPLLFVAGLGFIPPKFGLTHERLRRSWSRSSIETPSDRQSLMFFYIASKVKWPALVVGVSLSVAAVTGLLVIA